MDKPAFGKGKTDGLDIEVQGHNSRQTMLFPLKRARIWNQE